MAKIVTYSCLHSAILCLLLQSGVVLLKAESCTEGDIRLSGNSTQFFLEGRIEVCVNNQWGTVCDEQFDDSDAMVACRQLGFAGEGAVVTQRGTFGQRPPDYPIWFTQLHCNGSEETLFDCSRGYFLNCLHEEDAGVKCSNPIGVAVILEAELYDNNSIVFIEDIGYDLSNPTTQNNTFQSNALLCWTDKSPCCNSVSAQWLFPNGSVVPEDSSNAVFMSKEDDQSVRLNYLGGDFEPGIYSCEIPDQHKVVQTVHVGIYSRNSNGGNVMVSGIAYDIRSQTLDCTTSGGPVTDLVWSKDGIHLDTYNTAKYSVVQQQLADPVEGTYISSLTILDKSEADSGTYECTAGNALGENSTSITISVCRDGETRLSGGLTTQLMICSGDLWFIISQEVLVTNNASTQPTIDLVLQADTTIITFEFNTEMNIQQYELNCSTASMFTSSQRFRVNQPSNGRTSQSLFFLQPSEDYYCCVTLYYDTDLLTGLSYVNQECNYANTSNNTTNTPVTCNDTSSRLYWILIALGGTLILALLILLVVVAAWIMYCLKRASVNTATRTDREDQDGLTNLNPAYNSLTIPSRQDSVADNPVYGSSPLPSPGAALDNKDSYYESVEEIEKKRAEAKQQENEYCTIADNVTTVKNPVYGGHVRYSQLQFGKFQ